MAARHTIGTRHLWTLALPPVPAITRSACSVHCKRHVMLIGRCASTVSFHREWCYANCVRWQRRRRHTRPSHLPARTVIFVALSSIISVLYLPINLFQLLNLDQKSTQNLPTI